MFRIGFVLALSLTSHFAVATTIEEEFGSTQLQVLGCTSDGFQASVTYKIFNWSPMDMDLPPGHSRATLPETWTAAQMAFDKYMVEGLRRHSSLEVAATSFLSDLAGENVSFEYLDGQGLLKTRDITRIEAAIWVTKGLLYEQMKYTAIGVNYLQSTASVNLETKCTP